MADWGHRWPLWETGGETIDLSPTDLGLSVDLTEQLRSWYDNWEKHFSDESGWDAPSSEEESNSAAAGLIEELQQELGSDYKVEPKLY